MTPRHSSERPQLRLAVTPGPRPPAPGRHRHGPRPRSRLWRIGATAPFLILAAVLTAWLLSATSPETPAAHAAAVFIEISPDTVTAGGGASMRASCDDNLVAARATSAIFEPVALTPQFGVLSATVTVPADTAAGDYRVELTCPDDKTADTTLRVMDDGPAEATTPPPCTTDNPPCPATCPATTCPSETTPSTCPATCAPETTPPACPATCPPEPTPPTCACPPPTTKPTTQPPTTDPTTEPPTTQPTTEQPSTDPGTDEPGEQGLQVPGPGARY